MFEHLSAPLCEASEECLMEIFKSQLKPTIRANLCLLPIESLTEIMGLAHKIEEHNQMLEKTQDEFLNKYFKIQTTTKWIGPKGNWSRVSSNLDSTQTQGTDAKASASSISLNQTPETKGGTASKTTNTRSSSNSKGSSLKHLLEVEAAKKRAVGLCFKCDGKYSLTHQYKNKQLQVMLLHSINEAGEAVEEEEDKENGGKTKEENS